MFIAALCGAAAWTAEVKKPSRGRVWEGAALTGTTFVHPVGARRSPSERGVGKPGFPTHRSTARVLG